MFEYQLVSDTSEVILTHDRFPIGPIKLWVPEAVKCEAGASGVYPRGMAWSDRDGVLAQQCTLEQCFGPGNYEEVAPGVLECCGIRYPNGPPLPWRSEVEAGDDRIDYALTVTNPHDHPVKNVSAAVCIVFRDAPWWNDDDCYMMTADGVKSISDLGRSAGLDNGFQAWLLEGETCNAEFTVRFWGFNPTEVTKPVWVVRAAEAGCSAVLSCSSATYIHSNPGNPCNDLSLKFGDIWPGGEATVRGRIELTDRDVSDCFDVTV